MADDYIFNLIKKHKIFRKIIFLISAYFRNPKINLETKPISGQNR